MGPVLIVDDNLINREVLARKLVKKGFTVIEAEKGEEVNGLVLKEGPSIVIMDLNMPGKDGWAVCRELKSNPNTKGTPVIALTASYLDDGLKSKMDDAGFDGYLSKPADTGALLELISEKVQA